jgi:hypothetical protein
VSGSLAEHEHRFFARIFFVFREDAFGRSTGGSEKAARDRKIAELQRENARLSARAERAEALVDLQKRVASLLATPLEDGKL